MSKLTVPNKGQIAMAEKKLFEKLDNLLYNADDAIKLAKTSSLPILEAFDDPEHLLKYRIDYVCKEEAVIYSLQQLRKEWTDIRDGKVHPVYTFSMQPDDTGLPPKGFIRASMMRWELTLDESVFKGGRTESDTSNPEVLQRWSKYTRLKLNAALLDAPLFIVGKVHEKVINDLMDKTDVEQQKFG